MSLESQCSPGSPRKREQCRVLTFKVLAEITSVTPQWNAAVAKEWSLRNHHWIQSCKMLVTNFLWWAQTGPRQQEVNKLDRTRDWREGLDHKRKPRSRVIAEGGSRAEGRCFQEKKKKSEVANFDKDWSLWMGKKELRLPTWCSGKKPACQCRRCRRSGFSPWLPASLEAC